MTQISRCALAVLAASLLFSAVPVAAQTTATVRGVVTDQQGSVIPGADVRLRNGLTGLERTTTSDQAGAFAIANIPLEAYDLHVERASFSPYRQRIELRSSVPVSLTVVLPLSVQVAVTVAPDEPLVDMVSAGTRTQIGVGRIEQLPVPVGSRGLEAVLVTFPGFAQNANGAIHPRGAHNQMTFVVDGLPISDQLTGAFANALDTSIVQSAELITGNVPAEFGGKVSGVAIVTSRSGLGISRRLAGDVLISAAGFDTVQGAVQAGGGGAGWGYFASVTTMRTDRFLDQISIDNLHNSGAFVRTYGRVDLMPTPRDMVRVHVMGGRSAFELANLRSQQRAGQDQRQALRDVAVWGSHLRTLTATSTLESIAGVRTATAALRSSAGDTPVSATQDRRVSTITLAGRLTRGIGTTVLRAGADVQVTPVREHFTMGITSPRFNAPDDPGFNAALAPFDLTQGGVPFVFDAARTGHAYGAFVQQTWQTRRVTLSAGLRHDVYRFIVAGQQLQPRVGVAFALPGSAGVIRASYNRNYQTPPHENLLLSSSEAASRLAPESIRRALGGAYRPIRPERQNVYELGYQRAFGQRATLDVSAYRKRSRDQQDNNNFFNTGIIFPTALAGIDVTGVEARLTLAERRGVSGTLSATGGRAVSSPPFTGGLFLGQDAVDLLSSGPFAIDHDQRLSVHGTTTYRAGSSWISASVRHDSGLVANPSDPDAVAADPDFADLLPYVDLTAAVPRVRPRTIVDLALGHDVRAAGRPAWTVQIQVTNLTNRTALYNFQSVFVGTRLVQPRTMAVRVRRHF
ncbi:MAG: TonB-dependent receptor [Acidobacteria bacterium]|nr:TonB-dependent receptor [Acidobacteriota bacterium]